MLILAPMPGRRPVHELRRNGGFTLVEVLVAIGITALVGVAAFASLTATLDGVAGNREAAERAVAVERAWRLISSDLAQFANRPIRDEFGQLEPALQGGRAARTLLSLTRSGWLNTQQQPRSHLQRVNYVLEDDELWRESFAVLDRAPDSEPYRVSLLKGVESMDIVFLGSLEALQTQPDGRGLDTRNWSENWLVEGGSGVAIPPPVALEIRLELEDLGEMRRLYALPPI